MGGAAPGFEILCLISPSSLARFKLVKAGSCVSNRMSVILDRATCEAAAQVLQLADKTATNSSDTPKPEGCFYNTFNNNNDLYLSVNPANAGYGAAPGYEVLCLSTPSEAQSASITDNKAMIGGIAGGALLLCLIVGCCICRFRNHTKHFEARTCSRFTNYPPNLSAMNSNHCTFIDVVHGLVQLLSS